MSFDIFLSCLVLGSTHLSYWCLRRDVRFSPDINPNAQTVSFCLRVGKKMGKMYSLQGYDEVSCRRLWAEALGRMCFMYSTSFYTLTWEVSAFLQATIGSLSLALIGPTTALKWERKTHLEDCMLRVNSTEERIKSVFCSLLSSEVGTVGRN